MVRYVLGFIVCLETKQVLLIKKNKPAFQSGFYNGIGGKIEGNELPSAAMVRETQEECGIFTTQEEWQYLLTMLCEGNSIDQVSDAWQVTTFIANIDKVRFESFKQLESEVPMIWDLVSMYPGNPELLGNIPWLVGMGVDLLVNKSFRLRSSVDYTGLSLAIKL